MTIKAHYRKVTRGGRIRHRAVVSVNGKEYVKGTFDTAEEAWREKFRQDELVLAGHYDPKAYTLREAIERWLSFKDIKPSTEKTYREIANANLGAMLELPLHEVAQMRAEINDVLLAMHSQRRKLAAIVSGACNLAMAEDKITGHKLAMLEVKRDPRRSRELIPHTPEQLNQIVAGMPEYLRAAILIMRGTGMRIGEVLSLETDTIHDGYIEVLRGTHRGYDGSPKQRREGEFTPRRVPIPHWLEPIISEHVERFAKNGVLFPSKNNRPSMPAKSKYISANNANKWIKRTAGDAGLPVHYGKNEWRKNFTSHQFRKNWLTQLRAEAPSMGVQWEDIEEWAGHKNLTRDHYAIQSDAQIIKGRNLSDPRVNQESE